MARKNTSIIEEREELLIIINNEEQVRTVPKSPYYLLKYKSFKGNRIFYKFSEQIYIQETFDDGIFNVITEKTLYRSEMQMKYVWQ